MIVYAIFSSNIDSDGGAPYLEAIMSTEDKAEQAVRELLKDNPYGNRYYHVAWRVDKI